MPSSWRWGIASHVTPQIARTSLTCCGVTACAANLVYTELANSCHLRGTSRCKRILQACRCRTLRSQVCSPRQSLVLVRRWRRMIRCKEDLQGESQQLRVQAPTHTSSQAPSESGHPHQFVPPATSSVERLSRELDDLASAVKHLTGLR